MAFASTAFMKVRVLTMLVGAALALASATAARAQIVIVPNPVHEYTFANGLNDNAGGPALQSLGGTVSGGSYVFGKDQGLVFSDQALSAGTYTLELAFAFDAISGYQRIIDFLGRTSDTGLYVLSQSLNFYNVATAPEIDFSPGQPLHLVLTRDGTTQQVSGYINGQLRLSFIDASSLAVLSGANREIYFFADDLRNPGESGAGSVDFIRVFDQSLNSAQVLELYQKGAPLAVPEPSTWAMLVAGLGCVAFTLRRRRA